MVTVIGSMMWATMKNFLEVHAVKSDDNSSEGASNTNYYKLKRNSWINNSSRTPVEFFVYNCNDLFNLRLIPARAVYAQPDETIKVQGGWFEGQECDYLVAFVDNRGIGYNIKKNHLHIWNGSTMTVQGINLSQVCQELVQEKTT